MSRKGYPTFNGKLFLDVAIVVAALVLASSLAVFVETPARSSEIVNVDIWEMGTGLFNPPGVTINVGDTVMWRDYDDYGHTTTSFPGQAEYWDSGPLIEMETFSFTFTIPGNCTYYSNRPEDAGYVGWVYVRQPVPEFPSYLPYLTVAMAVVLAMLVERRLRAWPSVAIRGRPTVQWCLIHRGTTASS